MIAPNQETTTRQKDESRPSAKVSTTKRHGKVNTLAIPPANAAIAASRYDLGLAALITVIKGMITIQPSETFFSWSKT